ncbi:extensin family protein [Halomonas shantousis]
MKRFWMAFWLVLIAIGVGFDKQWWSIPDEWNPWAPLAIGDPPTPLTKWKLKQLKEDREGCLAVLANAPEETLRYTVLADHTPVAGCPLENVVRLHRAGVSFNSSFVATCPLAVAWLMFERHRLQPAAERYFDQPVARVDHYGSFACRNIYHRQNARRSEHASAEALDIAAFRLEDGRRINVLRDWEREGPAGDFLHQAHDGACEFFGTTLGPDYNAAHANHFHLGMRGFGFCR